MQLIPFPKDKIKRIVTDTNNIEIALIAAKVKGDYLKKELRIWKALTYGFFFFIIYEILLK